MAFRMVYDMIGDDAALSSNAATDPGLTEVRHLPLENMQNDDRNKISRTLNTAGSPVESWFWIDFPTAVTLDTVAFILGDWGNVDVTNVALYGGSSRLDFSTIGFNDVEEMITLIWPGGSRDGYPVGWPPNESTGNVPANGIYTAFFTPVSYRYWFLRVGLDVNFDLDIGRLILGSSVTMNYDSGFTMTDSPLASGSRSRGGQVHFDKRGRKTDTVVTLSNLSVSDLADIDAVIAEAGTSRPMLLSMYPDDYTYNETTVSGQRRQYIRIGNKLRDYSFYTRLTDTPEIEHVINEKYNAVLSFQETVEW